MQKILSLDVNAIIGICVLLDTEHKLSVHKTSRRRPGPFLNAIYKFNLRPVSRGYNFVNVVYKVNYRKNYVQDSDIAGD